MAQRLFDEEQLLSKQVFYGLKGSRSEGLEAADHHPGLVAEMQLMDLQKWLDFLGFGPPILGRVILFRGRG